MIIMVHIPELLVISIVFLFESSFHMHFNLVRSWSDFQLASNFEVRRLLEGSPHSDLIVKS